MLWSDVCLTSVCRVHRS